MAMTQISPMLAVSDAAGAIEFYSAHLAPEELWRVGEDHIVAGSHIHGAQLFLSSESPEHGTRSPDRIGHTTVRIELFVDDPYEVHRRARRRRSHREGSDSRTQLPHDWARNRSGACYRAAS